MIDEEGKQHSGSLIPVPINKETGGKGGGDSATNPAKNAETHILSKFSENVAFSSKLTGATASGHQVQISFVI